MDVCSCCPTGQSHKYLRIAKWIFTASSASLALRTPWTQDVVPGQSLKLRKWQEHRRPAPGHRKTHTHITHQNCHQRPAERWWYDIICDNALISLVLTSDPCCLSCPFSVFSTAMARRRLRFQAISTYFKWLAQNWRKNTKGFEAELVRWNVYMTARLHAEMASLVSTRHPHIHTHMQTCACTLNSNVWHTHTHTQTHPCSNACRCR